MGESAQGAFSHVRRHPRTSDIVVADPSSHRSVKDDSRELSGNIPTTPEASAGDISSLTGNEMSQGSIRLEDMPFRPSVQGRFRHRSSHDETTVDKLRFEKVGLHGRDTEMKLLSQALASTMSKDEVNAHCHQLILITGETGVGKSAIAKNFMDKVTFLKDYPTSVCLSGKFDKELSMQGPFAAFNGCIQHLLGRLLMLQENARETEDAVVANFQQELAKQLGSNECEILANTFEDLSDLLPESENLRIGKLDKKNPANQKSKLHGAFRKFLRIVSEKFRPLVFCIDDLQWADSDSLEMVRRG